jgi:3-oxoacyl-[acyl-carrier protein] reductase
MLQPGNFPVKKRSIDDIPYRAAFHFDAACRAEMADSASATLIIVGWRRSRRRLPAACSRQQTGSATGWEDQMDLRGAVALVTGGNGGLGQCICHALAKEGAHVGVMYAQSRDQAEEVARTLASSYQVNAAAFACDIADGTAIERLVETVTGRLGRIDILVNDAAYNKSIPFTDLDGLTMEVWDRIMAINLTGPMRLTKAVAPVMKTQGRGRIVNIASVAGLSPTGSSIAYAVSKAGLIHLTRCMAVALAPETLVNCIAPGLLEGTRATTNLRPEQIERASSGSLLKKAADKDDCADMVVTMCRTETMTGQTIVIDSGRLFH